MSNAMLAISPYKTSSTSSTWVFDDPAVGLRQEPFVSGMSEMIDHLVIEIHNAENGFTLLFSASPFPGYQAELTRLRNDGNWYQWEAKGMDGWLAVLALLHYFKEAPPKLYCKAEALPSRP